MTACVFCAIVAGTQPATVVRRWPDAIAIVPLNPVTDGHVLILPKVHIAYPDEDAVIAGTAATRAAQWARHKTDSLPSTVDYNILCSAGDAASQTVYHLHWHYIPRRPGDGLILPWTGQAVAG